MTDLEEERVAGLGRIMSLFSNENILTKEEIGSVLANNNDIAYDG